MKKILKRNELLRNISDLKRFYTINGYIPKIKEPKSFNEKILNRKAFSNPREFSMFADKIAAKKHVEETLDKEVVIPTLFVSDSLSIEEINHLIDEHQNIVVKANHNSGPVYIVSSETSEIKKKEIVSDMKRQLKDDYGKKQNETWYSLIDRKIIIEEQLSPEQGQSDLRDYKFHVFKQKDGSQKVLLHIDFERGRNHNRSFYDEDMNWLPFSTFVPTVNTQIEKPKNFDLMLKSAKKLAEPFSYVRIDFYNIDGAIYFGEFTFAPGSGISNKFTNKDYDFWMGSLWQLNDFGEEFLT
ncbi:ATP-grasp fold amidoligase family protein [Salinivibrio kushneri]|uniref:ATP-grasp fold amidoligase family protein n=1 Tax=Salinivibrio kushneri TaxID=1908198 RepID=A0AA47KJ39_9GAMM|nr:ATP-grasp fold amidoligase family protein [Salinivibrio kushneri]WBA07861.1 ATP-grasp fold amidoligase family protein [Salinivibrio kushneri]